MAQPSEAILHNEGEGWSRSRRYSSNVSRRGGCFYNPALPRVRVVGIERRGYRL